MHVLSLIEYILLKTTLCNTMIRTTKILRSSNVSSTLSSFTESTSNMTPFKKFSFLSVLTGASMGAVCGMYTGLNSILNDAKLDKGRWTRNNKDRTLKEQFQDYGMNPVVAGFLGFCIGGIAGAFTVTFSPIILPLAGYGVYYDTKKKEEQNTGSPMMVSFLENQDTPDEDE